MPRSVLGIVLFVVAVVWLEVRTAVVPPRTFGIPRPVLVEYLIGTAKRRFIILWRLPAVVFVALAVVDKLAASADHQNHVGDGPGAAETG
jgi:hypothetical protein